LHHHRAGKLFIWFFVFKKKCNLHAKIKFFLLGNITKKVLALKETSRVVLETSGTMVTPWYSSLLLLKTTKCPRK
jgi:hypothetical protein